jgi:predicted HTH domain antitoxin
MTEITISSRIPKEMARDLEMFMREESLEKSASIRKLLAEGLKRWKEGRALKLLREGRVSYVKAAEIAGMSVWEFADLVRKEDVVWIKSEKMIEEDIKKAP